MSRRERSRSRSRERAVEERRMSARSRSRSRDREERGRAKARDFSHLVRSEREERHEWGAKKTENQDAAAPTEVQKPNFGLSGALAKDSQTGNVKNGVVMKWVEPPDARIPDKRWRMYVFKKDENIATLHMHRQSAYLFGRDKKVADVHLEHESISKQHAVLQFRVKHTEVRRNELEQPELRSKILPYIMDLKSTNKTFLNGKAIEHSRYIELRPKDVLTFGESTREYVLLHATEE
ncbi:Smad nuclear-interacting protein 1 [Aphanomyces cochlioides]|nr:Smad nuclear-interacting protein 1 [Aphanomyces cochlioides]